MPNVQGKKNIESYDSNRNKKDLRAKPNFAELERTLPEYKVGVTKMIESRNTDVYSR